MSKKRAKRRDKPYSGPDAKNSQPNIHRYRAVPRSGLNEWWHERRQRIKVTAAVLAGGGFVVWLLIEAASIIF